LWNQEGTPAKRARGLGVGVFSGCFPLFGLQTILGMILARVFRGNKLLAAIATWVSNPITYLPLYLFNYQVGCKLLGDDQYLFKFNQINGNDLWNQGTIILNRLFLGSLVVGVIFGLTTAILSYLSLKLIEQKKN
tara:strand:+ start:371 stop:775 length:405 start_codon:yes stop_codon:yes gene_type:complete